MVPWGDWHCHSPQERLTIVDLMSLVTCLRPFCSFHSVPNAPAPIELKISNVGFKCAHAMPSMTRWQLPTVYCLPMHLSKCYQLPFCSPPDRLCSSLHLSSLWVFASAPTPPPRREERNHRLPTRVLPEGVCGPNASRPTYERGKCVLVLSSFCQLIFFFLFTFESFISFYQS